MTVGKLLFSLAFSMACVSAGAGGLPSWSGAAMSAWLRGSHQIANAKFADGAVTGVSSGSDPFWTLGVKPFRPTATQEVVFRGKSPSPPSVSTDGCHHPD